MKQHQLSVKRSAPLQRSAKSHQKIKDLTALSIEQLRALSKLDLALTARDHELGDCVGMSKEQIVQALLKRQIKLKRQRQAAAAPAAARKTTGAKADEILARRSKFNTPVVPSRDLSQSSPLPRSAGKDRIVAMVRDPYWIHVYWELLPDSVRRSEAALGQDWFNAKPVLRLLDVSAEDSTSSAEMVIRDIEIHGGVNNWYLQISEPAKSYRVDIGYRTPKRFFALARSNVILTPAPGMTDVGSEHLKSVRNQVEKIFALSGGHQGGDSSALREFFEETLRKPLSSGSLGEYGAGALGLAGRDRFHFEVDAELIVYGKTEPNAHVTLQGDPVQIQSDGTFTLRFNLPDGRQILPIVAQTNNGIEERTVILAIERNTKELEPMVHDGQE